jgi:hypothetical protein
MIKLRNRNKSLTMSLAQEDRLMYVWHMPGRKSGKLPGQTWKINFRTKDFQYSREIQKKMSGCKVANPYK